MQLPIWIETYLRTLLTRPLAHDLLPVRLGAAGTSLPEALAANRRIVLAGPAGSGKTTALLALAHAWGRQALAWRATRLTQPDTLCPIYVDLPHYGGDLQAAIDEACDGRPERWSELAQLGVVLLLDGWDSLTTTERGTTFEHAMRLLDDGAVALVAASQAEHAQALKSLPGAVVRPLLPLGADDVLRAVAGTALEPWLADWPDCLELATNRAWLAALRTLPADALTRRAHAIHAWTIARATLSGHAEGVWQATVQLAAWFDAQGASEAAPSSNPELADPINLLYAAGVVSMTADGQLQFAQRVLRDAARALRYAEAPPATWQHGRGLPGWEDSVLDAYELVESRPATVRDLMSAGLADMAARCLGAVDGPEGASAVVAACALPAPMYVALAQALAGESLAGAAATAIGRAQQLGYDGADLHGVVGALAAARGAWDEAADAFAAACARAPGSVVYAEQLSLAHARLGHAGAARQLMESVLHAQRQQAAATARAIGEALLAAGALEESLQAFDAALPNAPYDDAIQLGRARALMQLGNQAAARAALQEVLQRSPGHVEAALVLAASFGADACFADAIAALESLVAHAPQTVAGWRALAARYESQEMWKEARRAWQQVAQLRPEQVDAYAAAARACIALGDPDAALATYRAAVRQAPGDLAMHEALGALLLAQGRHDEALAAFRAVQQIAPQHQGALAGIGATLRSMGRPDEAVAYLRRVVDLAPGSVADLVALGRTLIEAGDIAGASATFGRALRIAPQHAAAQEGQARALVLSGQAQAAVQLYESAWSEGRIPTAWRQSIETALVCGDTARARRWIARVLRQQPDSAPAWALASQAHAAAGRFSPAVRAAQRAYRLAPDAAHAGLLADALHAAGESAAAIGWYEASLRLQPDSGVTERMAGALHAAGATERAHQLARRLLDERPSDVELHVTTATYALALGRTQDALALAEQAVALDQAHPSAQRVRAVALARQGQLAEARTSIRAAQSLAPHDPDVLAVAGQLAVQDRDYKAGIALLEAALAARGPVGAWLIALGEGQLALGAREQASGAARRALGCAGLSRAEQRAAGQVLLACGAYADAYPVVRELTEHGAADGATWLLLAQACVGCGRWPEAQSACVRALRAGNQDGAVFVTLAQAMEGAGNHDGAIRAWQEALDRDAGLAEGWAGLARLQRSRGDDRAALAAWQRAAALAPNDARVQGALGLEALAAGDLATAQGALEQATRRAGDHPDAAAWHIGLARCYEARGWVGEAYDELGRALQLDSSGHQARRERARLAVGRGALAAAHDDLQQVLAASPDDDIALELLAGVTAEQGDLDGALAYISHAAGLKPDRRELHYQRAVVCRRLGEGGEALKALETALASGGPPAWWRLRAELYEESGLPGQAGMAWEAVVRADPDDVAAGIRYARYLAQLGMYGDAEAALEAVRARAPQSLDARLLLIELLRATGRVDAALVCAEEATVAHPGAAEAWHALGAARFGAADAAGARAALEQAAVLAPHDAAVAALLADVAAAENDRQRARAASAVALAQEPDNPRFAALHARLLADTDDPEVGQDDGTAELSDDRRATLEQALGLLDGALDRMPHVWAWRLARGRVAWRLGDAAGALAEADRALEIGDNSNSAVLRLRALARLALGDQAGAQEDASQALATSPDDGEMLTLLGRLAWERGELERAAELLARAATLLPGRVAVGRDLARVRGALGRADEALPQLEELAARHADDLATLDLLHETALRANRRERALAAAARAARLAPERAEYHQRLATLYQEAGRWQEARAALMHALGLRPEIPAWHAQMAEICQSLGMRDAARAAWTRAAQLNPDHPEYLAAIARQLAQSGARDEAYDALARAVAAEPDRADWQHAMAELCAELGLHEEARDRFQRAVDLAPDEPQHWLALGRAHLQLDSRAEARDVFRAASGRFPSQAAFFGELGMLALWDESYSEAAAAFHTALQLDAQQGEFWCGLGIAQTQIGDRAAAQAALERGLALAPRYVEGHVALAQLARSKGAHVRAVQHMRRVVELAPDQGGYLALLGAACAEAGQLDEARGAYSRAIALLPDRHDLLVGYGELALAAGQIEAAVGAFERAVALKPDDPSYHVLAGRAHRMLKHYRRAIEHFRQAIRLRPSYAEAIVELSRLGPLAFVPPASKDDHDDHDDQQQAS